MKVYFYFNLAFLLYFVTSCNNSSFVGGSSSKKNKIASNGTNEVVVDVSDKKIEYSDPQEILDSMIDKIEQTIVAKDILNAAYLESPSDQITAVFSEGANIPPSARIDSESSSVIWQSDLQDIGQMFQGKIHISLANNSDSAKEVDYQFDVTAPNIEKVDCSYTPEPVIGNVTPQEKWHWNGYTASNGTRYFITYSAPVVADLDKDGIVEIITTPSAWFGEEVGSYTGPNDGPLVVLNGKTTNPKGEVIWNSYETGGFRVASSTTPAVIDLDNDGTAEIIATAWTNDSPRKPKILIIDYKKHSIRTSYTDGFVCTADCMPAVGDIDGDGFAEIVAGNVVLDSKGARKFFLSPSPPYNYTDAPTLAKIVPNATDPGLQIVSAGVVYSSTGHELWRTSCAGAGRCFSAVADMNQDGKAKLAITGNGYVSLYSASGDLLWAKEIPSDPDRGAKLTSGGGAPNIGDFNGDGKLEIGTASGDYYVVFDQSGTELWKSKTHDRSSLSTGSTLFDFNGDGKVEVVYNDEEYLRIYDGAGQPSSDPLWAKANRSGTLWEYPVIANIDDTPAVEIIVSAPGGSGLQGDSTVGGIRVFEDPNHLWVTSRNLWNQYSYYPEIVNADLTAVKNPGIPTYGFRVNSQGAIKDGDKILLPDLVAVEPYFPGKFDTNNKEYSENALTVFVKNQGQESISSTVQVELYSVPEGETKVLLKSAQIVGGIKTGQGKTVVFDFDAPLSELGPYQIRLNLDSEGKTLAHECSVENNKIDFRLRSLVRTTE